MKMMPCCVTKSSAGGGLSADGFFPAGTRYTDGHEQCGGGDGRERLPRLAYCAAASRGRPRCARDSTKHQGSCKGERMDGLLVARATDAVLGRGVVLLFVVNETWRTLTQLVLD
jgi:hypothetical protein